METLHKFKTETEYFLSQEFKDQIQASINKETWDKDLPKYYINSKRDMVEHFKDGTINVMDKSLSFSFLQKKQ